MGPDIEYAANPALTNLLDSVKRPGDFCARGRMFLPMPTVDVDGVGLLSFPVAASQVGALIEAAERAPYGKGSATLVDTSVRDCWQVDAARLRIGGRAWPETFATILNAAAAGLGCDGDALEAKLYKLLVYPTGGFFAPHRDTEKSDGMVATLTISLPTQGTGGELVVRHGERELTIELGAAEPSELAFAAFYADCAHETRPVRTGHRLSLVYNLCVLADDVDTPRGAPDYTAEVEAVAERLIKWRDEGVTDKLVWVLEHDYSTAGLAFGTLKNADNAVARVLTAAAERAECALHAAIVHIEEEGSAVYAGGDDIDSWHWRESDADRVVMEDVYDSRHWLDGWVGADGRRPSFAEIPLLPEETLPPNILAEAVPDEQRVHEASGNEGVSLERTYRRAALVVWPETKTLDIVASAGMNVATDWIAAQSETSMPRQQVLGLTGRLIGLWHHPPHQRVQEATNDRVRMLDLLADLDDPTQTLRFLRDVVLDHYGGGENGPLMAALAAVGQESCARYLPDFVRAHFVRLPDRTLALVASAADAPDVLSPRAVGASVRQAVAVLRETLDPERTTGDRSWYLSREAISVAGVTGLFTLAWRCGLADEALTAAAFVVEHPKVVTPDRMVPEVLAQLRGETRFVESAAYAKLWRHAVAVLLARSATPPMEPQDWVVESDIAASHCELCAKLRAFCEDPIARVERFPIRQELRRHLHGVIDQHGLDMFHVTERRGRPYTLVCTKNRASHERRLAEYAEDVAWMRSLAESGPGGKSVSAFRAQSARLQRAVLAADYAP